MCLFSETKLLPRKVYVTRTPVTIFFWGFVLEFVPGRILTRGLHGPPDLEDISGPPKNEGA